jgi:glutamate racemase
MVVVACNSSSSFALESLRKAFPLPIVGVIVPGACKAVQMTRKQVVGVIATSATINSGEYERTIKGIDHHIKVVNKACPLFVPLVEEGWFDHRVAKETAKVYLKHFASKIDVLILGCTHYPLLKKVIQDVMGPRVYLVDSAKEMAGNVKELLHVTGISNTSRRRAKQSFFVSDKPQHFRELAKRFLGCEINNIKKV